MLFDLHNDLITSGKSPAEIMEIAKTYSESLFGAVLAIWTTEIDGLPNNDFLPAFDNLDFAIEDLHFFTPDWEQRIAELNPLYCGLTWNLDNALAGGAYGENGLSESGRAVVDFLNSRKIAVDTAHLNARSFDEASDCAETIINSHTFIADLNAHPRNISFARLGRIVERGGVVGLTPVRSFMGTGSDVGTYVRGIDAFLQKFGDGNLCIGTDLFGSVDFPPKLRDYGGYSSVKESLIKLGYGNITVNKIMYGNALEFRNRRRT